MSLYWASNNSESLLTAQAGQASGTAIRTLLQIATPATNTLQVVAFGVEFATALTAACTVELVDTFAVAATGLTAHVAAGVQPYDGGSNGGASIMTLGTGATGYNVAGAATENTASITSSRTGKLKILPIGAAAYEWEWSLGREFFVPVSHFLRVRVTTANVINTFVWVLWQE